MATPLSDADVANAQESPLDHDRLHKFLLSEVLALRRHLDAMTNIVLTMLEKGARECCRLEPEQQNAMTQACKAIIGEARDPTPKARAPWAPPPGRWNMFPGKCPMKAPPPLPPTPVEQAEACPLKQTLVPKSPGLPAPCGIPKWVVTPPPHRVPSEILQERLDQRKADLRLMFHEDKDFTDQLALCQSADPEATRCTEMLSTIYETLRVQRFREHVDRQLLLRLQQSGDVGDDDPRQVLSEEAEREDIKRPLEVNAKTS